MADLPQGRIGCGPDEGPPPYVRQGDVPMGTSSFSLLSLFRFLSGMLQAPTPERYCEQWRRLEESLFQVGSRMFGQEEMEDGIQKVWPAEEILQEEPLSSESDVGGLDGV